MGCASATERNPEITGHRVPCPHHRRSRQLSREPTIA
jgi:hypothetical protein